MDRPNCFQGWGEQNPRQKTIKKITTKARERTYLQSTYTPYTFLATSTHHLYQRSENTEQYWKVGSEYSFEVNENFEIALNYANENKNKGNVYNPWTFRIAFKKFVG
jgi:hypothetical protein